MLYSPLITRTLAAQASAKGNLRLRIDFSPTAWNASQNPDDVVEYAVGFELDVDSAAQKTVFSKIIYPSRSIALTDGTLHEVAADTVDSLGKILTNVFMLNGAMTTVYLNGETPAGASSQTLPNGVTDFKAFADEVVKYWADNGGSTCTLEKNPTRSGVSTEFPVRFNCWLSISEQLYSTLALRAPFVAAQDSTFLLNYEKPIEYLFGTGLNALVTMKDADFYNKTGVSDDLSEDWFAHGASADTCVAASRYVINYMVSASGVSAGESNRLRTYSKSSIPQAIYSGLRANSSTPINPVNSHNYPTVRWGSSVISYQNARAEAGLIRKFVYDRPSGDAPSADKIKANLGDIDMMGRMPLQHLRIVMREYEALDNAFFSELWALGTLKAILQVPETTSLIRRLSRDYATIAGVGWSGVPTGCRAVVLNMTGLDQMDAEFKTIEAQAEAVSSGVALDADFVHVQFKAGVIIGHGHPAAWYEPYTFPQARSVTETVLDELPDGYSPKYSHGEDTDLTNFQYDQWYMSVDGSKGAWRAIRLEDYGTSFPAMESPIVELYGNDLTSMPDTTVDNQGVMSLTAVRGLLGYMHICEGGLWYPSSNGQGTATLPGKCMFACGSDEGNGLIVSNKKWHGSKSSMFGDDDYTGYLLGRSY